MKARTKNLASFEEVGRQEQQIKENMKVLDADKEKHETRYNKRMKKLERNRKNLLDITGKIEALINKELDHDDDALKTYSAEEVKQDNSKTKIDVSFEPLLISLLILFHWFCFKNVLYKIIY